MLTKSQNSDEGIDTATMKVFGIAELLENILVHLDCPRTLLLAQRVSIEWKGCITASTKLQKKLYFVSSTLEEAMALNMFRDDSTVTSIGPGETVIWNELLITDVKCLDEDNGLHFKLADGVVRDTISARRGLSSW